MKMTKCIISAVLAAIQIALVQTASAISASGGNTTTDIGGYRIHTFTSSGTLVVSDGGVVDVLVVAGGGGGGSGGPGKDTDSGGGGGGAGGLIYSTTFPVSAGSITVIVGSGGAGGSAAGAAAINGENSSFGALNAVGGGRGACAQTAFAAGNGGSGGGASFTQITRGNGTAGQGNQGGSSVNIARYAGGSGGGAGAAGQDSTVLYGNGLNGGDGVSQSVSGSLVYYAGGGGSGGGGWWTSGSSGSLGGGGAGGGGGIVGSAGVANTGGGGGGGGCASVNGTRPAGGNGGSGIVIVRYVAGAPSVANAGAMVTPSSVTLNGSLVSAGFDANVSATVFWGTSDAGCNMSGWMYTNRFSGSVVVGPLSTNAALASAGTRYFYRFFASNSFGAVWANPAGSFSSLGAPSVNNAGGAINVGPLSATLQGEVTGGNPSPLVWIYWGTVNQGSNKELWEHVAPVGEALNWTFAVPVGGLTPGQTYYYSCYASNSYGDAWSPAATPFALSGAHYVNCANPSPSTPYLTWSNAATNIQDALDVAVAGEVVIVTNGVYSFGGRVAASMTNRVAITNAVTVVAVSTNPGQTVISGAPDSMGGARSNGPWAVRGVYVGTGAQLIGITVTNGYSIVNGNGGGIYCSANSVVSNCVVILSQATYGGGIYAAASSVVSDCVFKTNRASSGGGVYCQDALVQGCTIVSNLAWSDGGGVFASAGGIISNCIITDNRGGHGGGVQSGNSYNCQINNNTAYASFGQGGGGRAGRYFNCSVISNVGGDGGGFRDIIFAQGCLIKKNIARYGGGGYGGSYDRCSFIANDSVEGNGGAADGGYGTSYAYLTNCLVAYNVRNAGVSMVKAVNCTIVANTNRGVGAGIGSSYLTNCIVYGNGISDFGNTTHYIGYTCARTNVGTFPGAVGIVTSNPMFVDSTNGDFRILRNSPCFNSGINQDWMINGVDMDGNPRICNFMVDMGAYEYSRPRGTIITILGGQPP